MRQLIDGKWVFEDESFAGENGKFDRPDTDFRNWITPDGSKGPDGEKDSRPKKIATIFTCHLPVHGHTEH